MSKLTTLHEFIVAKQKDFPFASGELSRLLSDIALAAKIVSNDVRKAGLVDHILGAQGGQNVQGEEQQKLDVVADEAFISGLSKMVAKYVALPQKKTMISLLSAQKLLKKETT